MQAKRGRKPLPVGKSRECVIHIRVTCAEMAAMKAAAKMDGSGVSRWAREILLWLPEVKVNGKSHNQEVKAK